MPTVCDLLAYVDIPTDDLLCHWWSRSFTRKVLLWQLTVYIRYCSFWMVYPLFK